MEKDQNINSENQNEEIKMTKAEEQIQVEQEISAEKKEVKEVKEVTPEEKINELEDKLTRTFAEMENQRRRFEKENNDAFDYGGFSFAKEALTLIDNLERSKQILESG